MAFLQTSMLPCGRMSRLGVRRECAAAASQAPRGSWQDGCSGEATSAGVTAPSSVQPPILTCLPFPPTYKYTRNLPPTQSLQELQTPGAQRLGIEGMKKLKPFLKSILVADGTATGNL
jgi:hypothetical protein